MPVSLTEFDAAGRRLLKELEGPSYRTFLWYAPVRAGKTNTFLIALTEEGLRDLSLGRGNGKYLVASATMGQVRQTMGDALHGIAEAYGLRFKERGGDNPHFQMGQYLRFYMRGGGDAGAYRPMRGTKWTSAFIDELTEIDPMFLDTVVRGMDYPHGRLFLGCNADSPFNFVKERFIDRPRANVLLLTSKWRENPHMSPEAYDELEDVLRATPHLYRRWVLNEWAAAEGVVFPLSERMVQSVEHEKKGMVSIDPGASGVTAATLFVPVGRHKYHVAAEYLHDREWHGDKTIAEHIDTMMERWTITSAVLDPITGHEYMTHLRRRGIRAHLSRLSVERGVIVTNDALNSGRLTLDPAGTPQLQKACAVHIWNMTTEKPVKEDAHLPDTLRYGSGAAFQGAAEIIGRRRFGGNGTVGA